MTRKKKISTALGIYALLFLASALTTSLIIHFIKPKPAITSPNQSIVQTPKPTPVRTDRSVLLIGYGGAGHDGGALADTLLLIRADSATKKLSFISIPRDTYVNIPTSPTTSAQDKINASYAIGIDDRKYPNKEQQYLGSIGGGNLAKFAVFQVTNLPVDYFISIDFGQFEKAIDALGGVDVEVPAAFDDKYYPVKGLENESCGFSPEQIEEFKGKFTGFDLEKQFTCRYEEVKFDVGIAHMDGATALKFVRSRHSSANGGDFARSLRQIAVLNAIETKVISLDALNKLPEFFKQFSGMITTDINPEILNPTLEFLGDPGGYTKQNINLSTDNVFQESRSDIGSYILIPKAGAGAWSGVQEYIMQELNK